MSIKPKLRDLLWMASGAALFLALVAVVLHFYDEPDPADLVAARARRIELVDHMRVALASSAESERSAVLALTDEDSQAFADQARTASDVVERRRQELAGLLQARSTTEEQELLAQFAEAFESFRRIDDELLELAVRNSNLKAYDLAYGPAAEALDSMRAALAGLVTAAAGSEAVHEVQALAQRVEIAALRVQAMLPPHIAEASDETMDTMEVRMAEEVQEAQQSLAALGAVPQLAESAGLREATAAWSRFGELRQQILGLSRENTNVRSLAISLNRKRKVVLACQEALEALRRAIEEEPIAGVTYGQPPKPR